MKLKVRWQRLLTRVLLGILPWVTAIALAAPMPSAERLPLPVDSYRDSDIAADIEALNPASDSAQEQVLNALLEQSPDDVALLAQRGLYRYRQGRNDEGEADFRQALPLANAGSVEARLIRWTYGWAQLSAGNLADALASWQEAESLHGGHPYWVPYTYAVVLWLMDEQAAAIDYYDAAVRSDPDTWGSKRGMTDATRHWQELARSAIQGLFAAWQAQVSPSP